MTPTYFNDRIHTMLSQTLIVFLILSGTYADSIDSLASYYMQLREYDKAINIIEKYDPIEFDEGKAKLLSKLYLINGEYERGLEHILKWGKPFQIAYAYEKVGKYEDAIKFYKELPYILGDTKLYHIGECLFSLGKYNEASLYYKRLLEGFPQSIYADDAFKKLATCYEELEEYEQAISLWRKYKESPISYYRMAEDYAQLGEANQAESLYTKLVKDFPASQYALKCLNKISEDPHVFGRVHFYNKDYRKALKYLRYLPTMEGKKLFAQALYKLRRYREAQNVFSRLGLHYEAAECYRLLGKYKAALLEYSKVKGEHIDNAYFAMAEIYSKQGNYKKAISMYDKIPKSSPLHRIANLRKGLIELNIGDLNSALITFEDTSKVESLYWGHKTYLKMGNKKKANSLKRYILERHPFSYYAYLLNEVHRKNIIYNTDVASWIASFADTTYELSRYNKRHLEKATLLLEYGIKEEAIEEIKVIKEDNPLFLYRLAELCHTHGIDNYAIGFAERVTNICVTNKIPQKLIRILYPKRFTVTLGELNKIGDDFLILALIRQESLFDPNAVSPSGALGLTQIMPSTGKAIAENLDMENFKSELLFNPYTNIRFGAYYFDHCLKRFDGKVELALLAYNGGPSRVAKWMSKGHSDSIDEFIEKVPITEPRLYVKKVLANYLAYKNIWQSD